MTGKAPDGPWVDLGCGQHPRGGLGITRKAPPAPQDATLELDEALEPYGWFPNSNAEILTYDIEVLPDAVRERLLYGHFLLCHVLEYVQRPLDLVILLRSLGAKDVTVVTPAPAYSWQTPVADGVLYGWGFKQLTNLLSRSFTVIEAKPVGAGDMLVRAVSVPFK